MMQSLNRDLQESLEAFVMAGETAASSHQHRRAARRLEQCLTSVQEYWFGNNTTESTTTTSSSDQTILQEDATPLLVDILLAEPQEETATNAGGTVATTSNSSWMMQDVQEAYQASCIMACRVLSLCCMSPEHVDALLERIANLLLAQQPQQKQATTHLMQLVHRQLQGHTPILLTAQESTGLVNFLLNHCVDNLKRQYTSAAAAASDGPLFLSAMQALCLDLLLHIVRLHEEEVEASKTGDMTPPPSIREWWSSFYDDGGAMCAHVWSLLQSLGDETMESVLDKLATAGTAQPLMDDILECACTAVELIQVLEQGFGLLFQARSLFLGLTQRVAPQTATMAANTAASWFALLLALVRKVLHDENTTAATNNDDASLQQAASVVLYMSLSQMDDSQEDDISFLLEYCGKDITALPAALLTTLLLPTRGNSGLQQQVVSSLLSSSSSQSGTSSPWNHVVARKLGDGGRTVQAYKRQFAVTPADSTTAAASK